MYSSQAGKRAGTGLRAVLIQFLLTACLLGVIASPAHAFDCRVGTYRLSDGTYLDVGPSDNGHLRWRRMDGTTGSLTRASGDEWTSTLGWTGRPDGKRVSFDCEHDALTFNGVSGRRVAFDVTETRFKGAGIELAGRLVMPVGTGKIPIVVLIHGSEHDSALENYALQRLFPAAGIGAFVYDKRGTGASGGRYTQDFLLLADDAIAAVHEARRLAGNRAGRVGYQAGSQGGWVAPLAAKIEPVDFVIVGFGLAVSPLEEDRESIVLDMTRHGYGLDVISKAMQIADATAEIMLSGFREGYDRLAALKTQFGDEPWFKYVHGDVTFYFLENSPAKIRETGPELLAGAPFQYDPMPVLRNLDVPQLWILGEEDLEAPSAETAKRLERLAASGRPITTAIFPHAEHGIYEFETRPDGTRVSTRQPEGYFRMMRDFVLEGSIGPNYGTARIRKSAHM